MSESEMKEGASINADKYLMPDDPELLDEDGVDKILTWASQIGASDVNFMTRAPVIVQLEGINYRITRRKYLPDDLRMMTNMFYGGANGVSHIQSGGEIDTSHLIREKSGKTYNYRVNVTGVSGRDNEQGFHAVIRTISGIPKTYDQLGTEQAIRDGFQSTDGLILVCGKTGSGKSTLVAAANYFKLKHGGNTKKILLFEDPIESRFDDVERDSDMLLQHEVPKNIASFARAIRNALRRSPTDIGIGECRDHESMSAAIEGAETGHLVTTTVHASSVREAFYRVLNLFPEGERSTKMFEMVDALRMIVVQKLVNGVDGRRVGLREFLIFDEQLRDRIRHVSKLTEAVAIIGEAVKEKGQTMLAAAEKAFAEKRISKEVLDQIDAVSRNVVDDWHTFF